MALRTLKEYKALPQVTKDLERILFYEEKELSQLKKFNHKKLVRILVSSGLFHESFTDALGNLRQLLLEWNTPGRVQGKPLRRPEVVYKDIMVHIDLLVHILRRAEAFVAELVHKVQALLAVEQTAEEILLDVHKILLKKYQGEPSARDIRDISEVAELVRQDFRAIASLLNYYQMLFAQERGKEGELKKLMLYLAALKIRKRLPPDEVANYTRLIVTAINRLDRIKDTLLKVQGRVEEEEKKAEQHLLDRETLLKNYLGAVLEAGEREVRQRKIA